MKKNKVGICAVVVTYQPDLEKLHRLFDALLPQVDDLVVVDNGSSNSVLAWLERYQSAAQLSLVALGDNQGIAVAQNVGIGYAKQQEADYVILFDHDSNPAPDMVARLHAVAEAKAAAGVNVAAVGPRYLDERQDNPPPFIQVIGLRVIKQPCVCGDSVVDVNYLIASGCLMPMRALDSVGYMREELFIDYVDIEWGLRAKIKGYQSFGACGALMGHDLGDEPFYFFGRKYPSHSALRHYYHFRNAIWMYRQSWIPTHWKITDGYRLILKYGFYALFAKPRWRHCWMMTVGMVHGLFGRMGRHGD